jgi:hypothetical protein
VSERQREPAPEPFAGISDLHRRLGHPVRVAEQRHQAYCVVCMVLWTSTDGRWYSTDLVEPLAA